MNFEHIVIERLRDYPHKKAAVTELREQIAELRARLTAVKSSGGSSPVQGGGSTTEDRYLNIISKIDLYKTRLREAFVEVGSMDRALAALGDEDREILRLFFIERTYNAAGVLAQRYSIDRSQVYRRRGEALRVLAMRLYGAVDA